MNVLYDPKYDDPAPSPATIREFVANLRPAFDEARAAGAALDALRRFGANYLTRAEVRLVERYGTPADRLAVAGQPR